MATVGAGLLAAPPAAAATTAAPRVTTLSGAWNAPWQLAVRGSRVLVTDGVQLRQVGRSAPIASGPRGGDVRGVALDTRGGYAYASSTRDHAVTSLTIVPASGPRVVAQLARYERDHNPDGQVEYGVPNASACVRAGFEALDGGPAAYRGKVDSHPVAVASAGSGWYVADAAANAVLHVDARGTVSTVAVLPRQPYRFSARIAAGLGLPSCVAGVVYEAEPTPTDVEFGPDGSLYVTVLPGLYDLGQAGSVYRIDPRTHRSTRLVTGLAGAANVAVTSSGTVYVAELLAGRIRVVRSGRLVPYLALPDVAGLETWGAKLYASTLPTVSMGVRVRAGRVVRIG